MDAGLLENDSAQSLRMLPAIKDRIKSGNIDKMYLTSQVLNVSISA
jgi:hypothetical protein